MAKKGSYLVVEATAGLQVQATALLGPIAAELHVAPGVGEALGLLTDREYDAVFAGPSVEDDDLELLVRVARERLCVALRLAPGPIGHAERRAAALYGCLDVVSIDEQSADLAALSALVDDARRRARQAGDELRRLNLQAEGLRQRCTRLAERFGESQETFYLDLSRMMTIITNIMDGIVFADRDGNVTLLNPVAEDLLGVKSFVAIGKPIGALQGRRELIEALAADRDRLGERKEVSRTVELHHSEQDLLYVKCTTSRVLDYRGEPAGALTVLKDVTAEFKTDQLKNQYLSIVAHELRTPLTGIKTFSTMMCKGTLGPLSEPQQRVCESIREQSVRLEHQIDKLINLGNLESDEYAQDREPLPIADFLNGLMAPFEQPARDRGIELRLHTEPLDCELFAGRADLRRACQALIENAVKFAADGGHVDVRVVAKDGGIEFGVRDDGIGIDPRYHRRVFEKFFQVEDPLTRHHGGAGLGLFVAKGIVEAHGSRIVLSSRLGQGADFSFMLPVHQPSVTVGAGSDNAECTP
jgi:PAS domain S-box-containing protein